MDAGKGYAGIGSINMNYINNKINTIDYIFFYVAYYNKNNKLISYVFHLLNVFAQRSSYISLTLGHNYHSFSRFICLNMNWICAYLSMYLQATRVRTNGLLFT